MKLSEMTVSMPMTTYRQIENLLNEYENLKYDLSSCFDTKLYDMDAGSIEFDLKKVLDICKKYLQLKYQNCDIVMNNQK